MGTGVGPGRDLRTATSFLSWVIVFCMESTEAESDARAAGAFSADSSSRTLFDRREFCTANPASMMHSEKATPNAKTASLVNGSSEVVVTR